MKKVYLIGDSIRGGYDSIVRDILQDEAQVLWPNDSSRYAPYTLRALREWAGDSNLYPEKIDLIHWNCGLWDTHRSGLDDMREIQTAPEEYRRVLKAIVCRMRKLFPNAAIAFANTTYVIEEYYGTDFSRRNSDIDLYNRIAAEVMGGEGVEIDDLYTVSRDMPKEYHSEDGTHFTPEGYRVLAEAVSDFLRTQLGRK